MAQKQLYLIFERLHIVLRNRARISEIRKQRNKVNLSRLTAAVIQKNILERKIFYRIKIFDPIPIFNATGPVPFPAVIVGVGSGIVDITESEE